MNLSRWSALMFVWPKCYLNYSNFWDHFEFDDWSEDFEWEQDGWNGLKDFASFTGETVTSQSGDCEDYALVAASWAYAQGRDVWFVLLWEGLEILPSHTITYDGERTYSSGTIREGDIEDFIDETKYTRYWTRKVTD